jgi:PPM family protein phosphatase
MSGRLAGHPDRELADPCQAAAAMELHSAARSHVGLVRAINEDRIFERSDHSLWAVADGMGGHGGGDIAATAVVEALRTLVAEAPVIESQDVRNALQAANSAIGRRNRQLNLSSGTTVVAAHAKGRELTIFWAGDSRAYLIRGGSATQLTRDHSLVQELVDAGLISAAAAEHHPRANVVTRALGVEDEAQLDSVSVALLEGDRVLLCSDGLSRSLRAHDFGDAGGRLNAVVDRMLADALSRDGNDNITLILIATSVD